jgi:DNA repair exonuclease SbcCD ATPase subunit
VGTELALNNDAAAAGLKNCPKCGYVQEQRLDCKKCGIVFSKYYALYPSVKSADSIPAMDSGAPELLDHDLRREFWELQTKVKALHSRFAEVEFEKAERNQLRTDLMNLERQLHENTAWVGNRLEQCEQRLEKPPASQLHQDAFDFEIPAIHDRLEQVEDKLGGLELVGQSIAEMREKQDVGSGRISDLENQISDLRREITEIRSILQSQEPRTPLEEDVHAIRKNLDDLRQFLSRNNES